MPKSKKTKAQKDRDVAAGFALAHLGLSVGIMPFPFLTDDPDMIRGAEKAVLSKIKQKKQSKK